MQFEVIRKSHKKEITIGVIVFVIIAIVLIVHQSFAKYQTTKNMTIVEGTVNYKVPDFKIMAMYKQKDNQTCTEDNCYEEINGRMPTSGYTINESKSYCTLDNANKDTSAILKTINGNHVISNLAKNEKCHLYFDKKPINGSSELIASLTVNKGTPDFSQVATTDEGIYKATDESGKDSYYFRGTVENNYVKFGKHNSNTPDVYHGFYSNTNRSFKEYNTLSECQNASSYNVNCTKVSKAGKDIYWRIIRINGDGSIRMIYDGTIAHANGTSTSDSIAVVNQKFSHKDAYWNSATGENVYTNDNMYVGFKYTSGQAQGTGTKSNVLEQLETWYSNNLTSYANKLDTNAGFCGDRRRSTSSKVAPNGTGGTGTTQTYYAAIYRLSTNKIPELSCETSDFYTVSGANKGNKSLTFPIGLITADEVAMAGGLYATANLSYYLYNEISYWTMSPYAFFGTQARVFIVGSSGSFGMQFVNSTSGVRPVINLRSDVTLTGTGTASDPYVVQ